jgi:hypothetical protein
VLLSQTKALSIHQHDCPPPSSGINCDHSTFSRSAIVPTGSRSPSCARAVFFSAVNTILCLKHGTWDGTRSPSRKSKHTTTHTYTSTLRSRYLSDSAISKHGDSRLGFNTANDSQLVARHLHIWDCLLKRRHGGKYRKLTRQNDETSDSLKIKHIHKQPPVSFACTPGINFLPYRQR